MVSTRRAAPDLPAKAEQDQEPAEATQVVEAEPVTEPTTDAESSTAQKRKDAPTEEESASKRQQLSPPEKNGDAAIIKQEPEAVGDADVEGNTSAGVNGNDQLESEATRATVAPDHGELDLVSRELLKLFADTTFEYLSSMVCRPDSAKGARYKILYERFKAARDKLPIKEKFVDTAGGEGLQNHDAFVRRANTVTFAASMLGNRDASFRQLDRAFFATFVGKSGRLLSQHADILLGLKTQAYISQAMETGGLREDILNELFPSDMTSKLLALRPDANNSSLVASEQRFVKQLTMRRRSLSEKNTPAEIKALKEKHKWNEVVLNMLSYIKQHLAELIEIPLDQVDFINKDGEAPEDVGMPSTQFPSGKIPKNGISANGFPPNKTQNTPNAAASSSTPPTQAQHKGQMAAETLRQVKLEVGTGANEGQDDLDYEEILARANAAADEALNDFNSSAFASQYHTPTPDSTYQTPPQYAHATNQSTPMPPQYALPAAYVPAQQGPSGSYGPSHQQHQTGQSGSPNHVPGQSQPTHQLYELARQATTGRSGGAAQATPKRTSQSQRRPWTQEEEQALMQGLDQVKGPHWSSILQLYGANGKINEVLKDRNQVQLKDKARNLKLWFLKSGVEVPVNLKMVTGELKTRAPAAVRNAAQNAASAPNSSHMHLAQGQTHSSQNYAQMQSPYAPSAGVYAPTAPPTMSTMSDMNATLATAGPDGMQGTSTQIDSSNLWNQDVVNQGADEAAQQALKDLQMLQGFIGGETVMPSNESGVAAVGDDPFATSISVSKQHETNGTASGAPEASISSAGQAATSTPELPAKTEAQAGTSALSENGLQSAGAVTTNDTDRDSPSAGVKRKQSEEIDDNHTNSPEVKRTRSEENDEPSTSVEHVGASTFASNDENGEPFEMDEAAIMAAAEAAAALATEDFGL